MGARYITITALLISAFAWAPDLFAENCIPRPSKNPTFGPDFAQCGDAEIDHMTTYTPEAGGMIEGDCKGGGTNPLNPCNYLFDDHVQGNTPCTVAATQRRGGSAPLYGCKAEVKALSAIAGRPVKVCFADVYASKESEGSKGTNEKIQRRKFDVAVRVGSSYRNQINSAHPGKVSCDGRVENTQNGDKRKIERNPEAKNVDGLPSPPSAGSPSGGESSPPAQYPEPSAKSVASPTGTSTEPKMNDAVKLGEKSKSPIDIKRDEILPSQITKSNGLGYIPPVTLSSNSVDAAGQLADGLSASESRKAAPKFGATGSSGGSESGGNGGAGGASGTKAEPGAESSAGGGSSSFGGGNGGGGGGGGGGSLSPFAADSKPALGKLDPASGDMGGNSNPGETALDEGNRDLASGESEQGDYSFGIGDKLSPSLFDRHHSYYRRFREREKLK